MTIEQLEVLLTANTDQLRKELARANKSITNLETETKKSTSNITGMFTKLKKVAVGLGIGALLTKSIKSGLDYIANDTMYQATMGEWKDATRDFTEELKSKLGVSRSEMRRFIGSLYNITTSMGIGSENAYKMSKSLATLTQDMASFWNITTDEALDKLQSGLTGNTQALRSIGVVVNEATIKQVAYSEGIAKTGTELTEQQKVMARYVAIMKQTTNMQGYLASTIESPNAQLRMLKDTIRTLSQDFGQLFIPVLQAVLPVLNAFAKLAVQAVSAIASFFNITIGSKLTEGFVSANKATGGISDDMATADKNANKLKQTLAGFDEMNVLTEPTDSGSGGGGMGGGGDAYVLPEYDYSVFDNMKSKADEIAESIKAGLAVIFEPFKNSWEIYGDPIFNGIKNSFSNLGETFKIIGNIFYQVWQEQGQKVADTFFTVISGIVQITEDLTSIALSFWIQHGETIKNFLSGIVETCTMVVDFVVGLVLSIWDNGGKQLVEKFGEFGAKLAEFANFINKNYVQPFIIWFDKDIKPIVVGAFSALSDAVSWFLDIIMGALEWLQNDGKPVLDVLVIVLGSLAVAFGIVQGAITIYNVIMGIATGVSTAFGAVMAFITSPIGLVVLAITALIAIGVLLYKNWDTIVECGKKLWSSVKDIFQKIGDFIGGIFKGVVNAGIGMVNSVIGMVETMANIWLAPFNLIIKGLNKIPGVNVPELKVSLPKIPKLQKGGIIDRATLIEAGENGKEVIMPLENNTGWITKLATDISSLMGGGKPINLTVKIGEDTLLNKVISGVNNKAFELNEEVFV